MTSVSIHVWFCHVAKRGVMLLRRYLAVRLRRTPGSFHRSSARGVFRRNQHSNSPVPHPASIRSLCSWANASVSAQGWSGDHAERDCAWIRASPSDRSG